MNIHDKQIGLVGKTGKYSHVLYISTRIDIVPFFKINLQEGMKPRNVFKNLMVQFQEEKSKMKEFGFEEKENCCKWFWENETFTLLIERSILKSIDFENKNLIAIQGLDKNEYFPLIYQNAFSDHLIKSLLDVLKKEQVGMFPFFNQALRDAILNHD